MTNIVHNYPLWNNGRVVIKHGAYVGPRVVINHSTLTLLVWTEEDGGGRGSYAHLGFTYLLTLLSIISLIDSESHSQTK